MDELRKEYRQTACFERCIYGRIGKTDERHVAGRLITEMATRLEDSSITSLEGLQNAGILNSTNMYVPDNFLLEKEKVSFLYNKYDIAPYAVGVITLSLPYTSVEKYMIH